MKYPEAKHYCGYCSQEWKRKDLLKCFRCPECQKFTKAKSAKRVYIEELEEKLRV